MGGNTKCIQIIHIMDELKHNICETRTSIIVSELRCQTIFSRNFKFLQGQKRHFEHLL
jgi:hypothetical protein